MAARRHTVSELNLEGCPELLQVERGRYKLRNGISKGTEVGKSQISGAKPGCILKSPQELLQWTDTQTLPSRDSDVSDLG